MHLERDFADRAHCPKRPDVELVEVVPHNIFYDLAPAAYEVAVWERHLHAQDKVSS